MNISIPGDVRAGALLAFRDDGNRFPLPFRRYQLRLVSLKFEMLPTILLQSREIVKPRLVLDVFMRIFACFVYKPLIFQHEDRHL